jgi:hypothetical protein
MYVSVTGLKPKGFIGWIRFWLYTIPASNAAQKAEGVLHCEFKTHNGYQQTFTVWETRKHMMAYVVSPAHFRAMKSISQVGSGKVFGYEADSIPSWDDALAEFDRKARVI